MEIFQNIHFSTQNVTSKTITLTVTIPQEIVSKFFDFAAKIQQKLITTPGFKQGETPLNYIKTHHKKNILRHLQEIGLQYFVIDTLMAKLKKNKIVILGQPKLISVTIDTDKDAVYTFQAMQPTKVHIQRWKNLPFKATQRKKYRDIDNQVINFLQEEAQKEAEYDKKQGIAVGDWICFDVWLTDTKNNAIFDTHKTRLWLRIGKEEPDTILQKLFIGKHIGDIFTTTNQSIRDYFCDLYDSPYMYSIEIIDIMPQQYISIPHFKKYFKLKNKKDIHNKFIEVFSFNSDISQRRLIAHNALAVIRSKNEIEIPEESILEQEKIILEELQKKADYMVYKMESNFHEQVRAMAKNQVLEKVTVDALAHQENVSVSHDDIKGFLNLLKRTRTKDFIYFHHPLGKIKGQEVPIPHHTLAHCCLREKTLNYIINHLTQS